METVSNDVGRFLRLPEVIKETGKSRSMIYAEIGKTFPRPVPIGKRAIAFLESEITNWKRQKVLERGNG